MTPRFNQRGFGLLIVILALAIIAVLVVLYYKKPSGQQTSPAQTEQKAKQDINAANGQLKQYQEQIDMQNNLGN